MTSESGNSEAHIRKRRRIHAYVIVFCLLLTGCLPRYSDFFDNIVQIVVGPEAKVFNLYKQILCDASSYFNAALKGDFKEAHEQNINMPDEDVDTFTCFQIWLYSKELPLTDISGEELDEVDFVDLYIFGEARDIPEFQNAVMDALITKDATSTAVTTGAIRRIYEHTSKTSPLRKLILDFVLHYLKITLARRTAMRTTPSPFCMIWLLRKL